MSSTLKFAAVPSCLAALSLIATPVAAAEHSMAAPQIAAIKVAPAWNPQDDRAADRRRGGWGNGWGGGRGRGWGGRGWNRYDDDDIDAGDVIAGIAVIGVIAAIASAASRKDKDRDRGDYRYPDGRYPDGGRYDNRNPSRSDRDRSWGGDGNSRGLNNAVEQCVNAIERDQRVDSVNSVDRAGTGWTVSGSLFNGAGFTCTIGADGKIEHLDTGSAYRSGEVGVVPAPPSGENRQWGDDRYAAERARMDGAADAAGDQKIGEPQPEYPGGPLPGEEATT